MRDETSLPCLGEAGSTVRGQRARAMHVGPCSMGHAAVEAMHEILGAPTKSGAIFPGAIRGGAGGIQRQRQ